MAGWSQALAADNVGVVDVTSVYAGTVAFPAGYATRPVQFRPDGGQFDFAPMRSIRFRLALRTYTNGAYVWRA